MSIARKRLHHFLSQHKSDVRVLDIGAGGAAVHDTFFPNRVTVDIDPNRNPDVVADAHQLPFADAEFAMILCTEVLEHLKDPRKAVSEMGRVLVPGGTLILTTRFVYPLHDVPHDYYRYTKYGLQELFASWDIETLEAEAETFSTIGIALQRIGYQTVLRGGKFTKLCVHALAFIFDHLNWIVISEYGDIKRTKFEEGILASGYYLVCKRRT